MLGNGWILPSGGISLWEQQQSKGALEDSGKLWLVGTLWLAGMFWVAGVSLYIGILLWRVSTGRHSYKAKYSETRRGRPRC